MHWAFFDTCHLPILHQTFFLYAEFCGQIKSVLFILLYLDLYSVILSWLNLLWIWRHYEPQHRDQRSRFPSPVPWVSYNAFSFNLFAHLIRAFTCLIPLWSIYLSSASSYVTYERSPINLYAFGDEQCHIYQKIEKGILC